MSPPRKAPTALVLWLIWAAITASIVFYQFALGHGIPRGADAPSTGLNPILIVVIVQLAAASYIRWRLIPHASGMGQMLVLLIIGLALSEAVEIFGLFLIAPNHPSTKLTLWVSSFLSAAQFAPTYARTAAPANAFRQR